MTRDERFEPDPAFERDLASVVRDGAPEGAPPALRGRVESSLRSASAGGWRRRRISVLGAAAGVVVLLVATVIVAPRLVPVPPGATPTGSSPAGTGIQSPSTTTPAPATAPPLAEPIADPGEVQTGQLLTATDGWVHNTGGHVFLTHSGGAAWREITPAGLRTETPLPFFVDPIHGWIGEYADRATPGLVVWRTSDAGVTWSTSDLPDVRVGNLDLVFLTPMVGWLAGDPGGQAPKPELRWTSDGGATWSAPIDLADATGLATLPLLAFADPQHGALTADGVVRATSDGGRSWVDVDLPGLPSIAPGSFLGFGLPVFVDQQHGFLTVSITNADLTPLTRLVFATETAGASWHLALQDDRMRSWAFLSESTWIAVEEGRVWTTRDGGVTFDDRSSSGLPTPLDRAYMTFVDPLHGWAQAVRGGCPSGNYGCPVRGPEMFATSDGGQTWTRIGDCIFLCAEPKPS
jgi:photosystem II stability/assembly factor-like uncharacterized protein